MKNAKRLRYLVFTGIVICVVLVLLAGVAIASENQKKSRAHEQCKYLAKAVKVYTRPPGWSPGSLAELQMRDSATLNDLVHPPFGGPSWLENGEADLIDPWGNPYQMERAKKPNGDEYIIVKTTAPDGTPITQFGIGPDLVPKFE
jgi:general secretion pathway protein G